MVGWGEIELLLPACNSLKDKRQILSSILIKLKKGFNVSICEVESQDKWQRAKLQIAIAGTSMESIHHSFDGILKALDSNPEITMIDQNFWLA